MQTLLVMLYAHCTFTDVHTTIGDRDITPPDRQSNLVSLARHVTETFDEV
jgi:hypothetical protein